MRSFKVRNRWIYLTFCTLIASNCISPDPIGDCSNRNLFPENKDQIQCSVNQNTGSINTPVDEPHRVSQGKERQLGLLHYFTECDQAGPGGYLNSGCKDNYQIRLKFQCIQEIAGREVPQDLVNESISWKLSNEVGQTTLNKKGESLINLKLKEKRSESEINRDEIEFKIRGRLFKYKVQELRFPATLSAMGCQ